MKKLLSILLVAVMMLSLVPAAYAAKETPFYYWTYGDTTNGGVGRSGQTAAIACGQNAVWGSGTWGENPAVKDDTKTVSTNSYGNEGILPASGNIDADDTVYWVKTGIWPSGDTTGVICADSSKTPKVPVGGTVKVTANGFTMPTLTDGKVAFEVKVRFDDHNAARNVISLDYYKNADKATASINLIQLDTSGNINLVKRSGTKNIVDPVATYTPGTWYTIKIVYNFTENSSNYETYSAYINGECIGEDIETTYNTDDFGGFASARLLEVKHTGTVTERQFSNSYIAYGKFSSVAAPVAPVVNMDVTGNTSIDNGTLKVTRIGHDDAYRNNFVSGARLPSLEDAAAFNNNADGKKYYFDGVINPEGFDGLKRVWMLQSWTVGNDIAVYTPGVQFNNDIYSDVILETKVRFDDYNASREVFFIRNMNGESLGSDRYTLLRFANQGKVTANHQSEGVVKTKVIGEWTEDTWYVVKAVFHVENNLYDVYLDGVKIAENLYSPYDLSQPMAVHFVRQLSGEDISEEKIATSFLQYAKVYYDEDSTYQNPTSYFNVSGFKKLNSESRVYEDATELSTGEYAINVDVLNNDDEDSSLAPTFILAFYKGNHLISVNYIEKNASYPSNISEYYTLDVNFDGVGEYSLRAYVWDGVTMVPMNVSIPSALTATISE